MKTKSNSDRKLEKRLDEALEATFPCSDPVSINQANNARPDSASRRTPAPGPPAASGRVSKTGGKAP